MPAIHLGKLELHWCHNCNVPVLSKEPCSICSEDPLPVKITPPGDVRPAFEYDLDIIRETIDRQWGDGYWEDVVPRGKIVLLNSCPSMDRMDEVIIDGEVIGTLRYDLRRRFTGKPPYQFLIRPWKGLPKPKKGFVLMHIGAVKPIQDGASALAVGIMEADTDIEPEDEVLILDPHGYVIATGPSFREGKELLEAGSGKGIKTRWRTSDHVPLPKGQTWEQVISANKKKLESMVKGSVDFIRDKVHEFSLPAAVSYSGGKDSLATLLLALEADIDMDMLFVDTGIELPETLENVVKTAERYGLDLKYVDAKDGYWESVKYFGPSARDYRWCCKTCKLGPIAGLIKKNYPDGVLSFIGQRRYESENRMQHGNTWNNPWIPGQVGASPIQDWTALHVWLFLFSREAEYNPWYEKGFERIGCWLCPASDLAELDILKENYEGYERFESVLKDYSARTGLPQEWIDLGMWRWLEPPEDMMAILEQRGIEIDEKLKKHHDKVDSKEALSQMERAGFLIAAGDRNLSQKDIFELYLRAKHCLRCGVCSAMCPMDAISTKDGIRIDKEICTSCGRCIDSKCPIVEFSARMISC